MSRLSITFDVMCDRVVEISSSLSCEISTIKCAEKQQSFESIEDAIFWIDAVSENSCTKDDFYIRKVYHLN